MALKKLGCLAASLYLCVTMAAPASAATNEELKAQVRDTETAFAATMKQRDLAAFASFVSDETVFYSPTPVHGKEAVVKLWTKYYEKPQAPFSWVSDDVEVLASGTLAISNGSVFDPEGNKFASFSSIWRLEAPGKWRIIFDHGWPLPPAKPK